MNETLNTLKNRRSIRKYKEQQISEEQLNEILEAGMYAPTCMGAQSPVMVVIQNKELIKTISKMNAEVMGNSGSDPFYGAPTLIVVFADSRLAYIEDGSLVMGNLMNAAYSVGVDSCWVHRAREVFLSEDGKALMKEWGIGSNYIGVGNCILGYRNCEYPEAKPRKDGYIIRL